MRFRVWGAPGWLDRLIWKVPGNGVETQGREGATYPSHELRPRRRDLLPNRVITANITLNLSFRPWGTGLPVRHKSIQQVAYNLPRYPLVTEVRLGVSAQSTEEDSLNSCLQILPTVTHTGDIPSFVLIKPYKIVAGSPLNGTVGGVEGEWVSDGRVSIVDSAIAWSLTNQFLKIL